MLWLFAGEDSGERQQLQDPERSTTWQGGSTLVYAGIDRQVCDIDTRNLAAFCKDLPREGVEKPPLVRWLCRVLVLHQARALRQAGANRAVTSRSDERIWHDYSEARQLESQLREEK